VTIHGTLPVWMWPLLLIGAAGAVFWVVRAYAGTRPAARRPYGRVLVGLRIAVVLLLLVAVAGPVMTLVGTRDVPARLALVLEDSGSMALSDTGPAKAGPAISRWAQALNWSAALDSAFADFPDKVELVLLRGNGREPVREFRLGDPVIPDPGHHGTDLGSLVGQVNDRLAGRSARATILFSDGQETGRSSGSGRNMSPGPVQVVGVGDPRGPADRMIKDLRYPDAAYSGDEVVVEFAVDHRFIAAEDTGAIRVTLSGPDGFSTHIDLTGGENFIPAEITFSPEGQGLKVFELDVAPLDNERFLANNKATLAIDVRRERARVLLVAHSPGWDVRLLAQAALAEERLELVVVQPTATGLAFADSLVPWPGDTPGNPWLGWDGIILAGWPRPGADPAEGLLDEAVRLGAGLLVLPGPADDSVGPGAGTPMSRELVAMLPVTTTSWRPERGRWFLDPALEYAGHPVLEGLLSGGVEPGSGVIAALPPLGRVVRVDARPGAEVLMTADQRGTGSGLSGMPLLVSGARDAGRVVWFGGRRLWELAFWELAGEGVDPAPAEQAGRRLLRNLLVWVGSGGEDSGLVFTGRQPFFQEGERISLYGRWRDLRGRPVTGRRVSLQVRAVGPDSARVRTFGLVPVPSDPGMYQADMPPQPPGDYRIRLVGEGDPAVLGPEENLVVTAHTIEMTQVRADRRRLVRLASQTGGSFHAADDPAAFAALMQELQAVDWSPGTVVRRQRIDFWSTWPFLSLVALLLGLEWFIRRRQGQL
jgi:hypothetical protein